MPKRKDSSILSMSSPSVKSFVDTARGSMSGKANAEHDLVERLMQIIVCSMVAPRFAVAACVATFV
jgi:hypothetical protein